MPRPNVSVPHRDTVPIPADAPVRPSRRPP